MKKILIKLNDNQNVIEPIPTEIFEKFGANQFKITKKMFNCTRIEKEIEYLLVNMIIKNHPK